MSTKLFDTPILLVIFNRPESTKLLFEVIKKIKPQKLYVAADGPRVNKKSDPSSCLLARNIINPDWDCDLKTLYQETNLGCGKGPATAIKWFFENEEQGIILEDDCIPEIDFFYYCQELLYKYKTNVDVFNICGSNLGFNPNIKESYFASKFMNMSGWATWRRTAQKIDYAINEWRPENKNKIKLFKALRYHKFDFHLNWILFWDKKIKETITQKNVTYWDYQWILYQLSHNQFSIIPSRNLVKNIGFDENATHTISADHPIAFLETFNLKWPLIHPENIHIIRKYEEEYIKGKWLNQARGSYIRRIKRFCKDIIKKTIKIFISKDISLFNKSKK
jgi:hypothetical protein